MSTDWLTSGLKEYRLNEYKDRLLELGVKEPLDLLDVIQADLTGITALQWRRFEEFRSATCAPIHSASSDRTGASTAVATDIQSSLSDNGMISAGRHYEKINVYGFDDYCQLKLVCQRNIARKEFRDECCKPEDGWALIEVNVPSSGHVTPQVDVLEAGVTIDGRRFVLVSCSKGAHQKPAHAWMVSPPPEMLQQPCTSESAEALLETSLRWKDLFLPVLQGCKRPHPLFLLRARVKQLFSDSWPIEHDFTLESDDTYDVVDTHNRHRNDGAGLCDPNIAEQAYSQIFPDESIDLGSGR